MRNLLIISLFALSIIGWRFQFTVDTDRATELTIGMENGATSGFDIDLDQVAPPPPPEGSHPVFPISDKKYSFIEALWGDIRGINDNDIWNIKILGLSQSVILKWNPNSIPQGDIFYNDTLSLKSISNGTLPIGMTSNFTLTYHLKMTPSKINSENKIPTKYEIQSITPNPFNSSTNIIFTIPDDNQKNEITLRIIDILGRPVNELFNGELKSGTYKMIWDSKNKDGIDSPSGLYFVELKRNQSDRLVNKILLVR